MLKIISRELGILIHKRKIVLFVLLGAASAYAILIGNLYHGHIVEQIPVIICDLDDSKMSRELIRNIAVADQYELIAVVHENEVAISYLEQKKAAALLVIPHDFSRDIELQHVTELAFITDGSNTLQQGYAAFPMQGVVETFAVKCQAVSAAKNGFPTIPLIPVQTSLRITENPTQSYAFFYLYGVMLTAAQIGVMASFSLGIHEDFRKQFFYHNGIVKTLVAKEIIYIVFSLFSILIGLDIIISALHMPYKGSLIQTFFLCTAFIFAAANMAGVVALYFKTEVAMIQCLVFYTLPAFLLSGYIWPELGMLPVIRWISYLLPVHYILTDFRELALNGAAYEAWLHSIYLLAIGGVEMGLVIFLMKCRQRETFCR